MSFLGANTLGTNMQHQKYSSSSYARILFRHLRLSGDNSHAFFAGTAVSYEELMALDGTINHDDLAQIYRNALAIANHEDLGLSVGAQLHLSAHGPLGVATFSGPDLGTALGLLAQFSLTRTEFFNVALGEHPEGIRVRFTETSDLGDLRVFVTESVLSGLFSAINFFVGAGHFKGQVNFAYAKPSYGHRYRDHFGNNISFDHPTTEIIISKSILAAPSPAADPILHRESVAICERQLREIKSTEAEGTVLSMKEQVSKLMQENPGRLWSLNEVASKLSVSPRTLIRKLQSEGTKFQIVKDELAKRQVTNYLADGSLSVESIGHLMGFSDVSSFRRSFKRWFGETPSAYITRVRGASKFYSR